MRILNRSFIANLPRRFWSSIGCLLQLAALGGCASVAPPVPVDSGRVVAPADRRAASPAALSAERQWLKSWFEGTPVEIVQRDQQSISIEIPREHCFEPGHSRVKPALAAVLDKAAQSLLRLPYGHMVLIAAPEDAKGSQSVALNRAAQVRRHLRLAGVPDARLGKPTATTAAAVQLRIAVAEP